MHTSQSNMTKADVSLLCMWFIAVVAMLCFVTPSPGAQLTNAQNPPVPYGQAQDGYLTNSGIAIQNNILYMTWPASPGPVQRSLAAIDISIPAKPILLNNLLLPGFPQSVAILENHAYVVTGQDIIAIDITNPKQMKITHTLRIADNPMQGPQAITIDEKQHAAYLACRGGGIAAINLKQQDKPTLIGKLSLPGFARDVTMSNQKLIVAADTLGVHVINLPKSATDFLQAKVQDKYQGELPQDSLHLPYEGTFSSVTVDKGDIFLTAGRIALASYQPDANVKKGEYPWPRSYNAPDRGEKAVYYGCYAHHMAIININKPPADAPSRIALIADGEAGLSVINISGDKQADYIPQPITNTEASSDTLLAINLIIHNNHAFVIDQNFGLRIYDLTNPVSPKRLDQSLKLPITPSKN